MLINIESIQKFTQKYASVIPGVIRSTLIVGSIIFGAYLLASSMTASSVKILTQMVLSSTRSLTATNVPVASDLSSNFNYREMRKTVLDRNVFNSEGQLPDEVDDAKVASETEVKFDENAPCKKTSLNIELVGTIFMGAGSVSLATVKEKGYNEADVYVAGDTIMGQPQAQVHKVEHERVIINNAGSKECLELAAPKLVQAGEIHGQGYGPPGASPGAKEEGEATRFTLQGAYVEQSLGAGFSKILESGRLVPHNKDNQMIGFKLIGVKSDSLWRRINLNSGDVITAVNDISMAKPDQGFAVYQALQDAREIRIEILKGGTIPATHTVEIK